MNSQKIEAENDYLASQIARHDEEIEMMRELMCTKISSSIEAGIMKAVRNPALWTAAGDAIQAQARAKTGGWVFGGISLLFSRISWVLMALLAVYSLGGWSAVAGMIKAWLSHGGHS